MWTEEEYCQILLDGYKTPGEKSDVAPYVGTRKLNLGCGTQAEPTWNGWLNADFHRHTVAGVLFDARRPWPFRDGTFDTVQALYVLHLFSGAELFAVVHNIGRALSVGGHLIGRVPFGATGNPMQLSFWTERTPSLFDCRVYESDRLLSTAGWDQGLPMCPWDVVRLEVSPSEVKFIMRRV